MNTYVTMGKLPWYGPINAMITCKITAFNGSDRVTSTTEIEVEIVEQSRTAHEKPQLDSTMALYTLF